MAFCEFDQRLLSDSYHLSLCALVYVCSAQTLIKGSGRKFLTSTLKTMRSLLIWYSLLKLLHFLWITFKAYTSSRKILQKSVWNSVLYNSYLAGTIFNSSAWSLLIKLGKIFRKPWFAQILLYFRLEMCLPKDVSPLRRKHDCHWNRKNPEENKARLFYQTVPSEESSQKQLQSDLLDQFKVVSQSCLPLLNSLLSQMCSSKCKNFQLLVTACLDQLSTF